MNKNLVFSLDVNVL